jgi:hypothetical protein
MKSEAPVVTRVYFLPWTGNGALLMAPRRAYTAWPKGDCIQNETSQINLNKVRFESCVMFVVSHVQRKPILQQTLCRYSHPVF